MSRFCAGFGPDGVGGFEPPSNDLRRNHQARTANTMPKITARPSSTAITTAPMISAVASNTPNARSERICASGLPELPKENTRPFMPRFYPFCVTGGLVEPAVEAVEPHDPGLAHEVELLEALAHAAVGARRPRAAERHH